MSVLYADTSAIIRAHMPDEPDHAELEDLLFRGDHRVLTSELTRVEFASAMASARDAGRIPSARPPLARFDADSTSGVITLIPLMPRVVMPAAYRLVADNPMLRALDAIHLAVALHDTSGFAEGEPVKMVTRDKRQAAAARAHGLEIHE